MKINPKQLEKMAKRMGIQATPIDAEEVIIKTSDKEIVILNPQVSKVNMMGQETFQITGEPIERERESFSDEDAELVAEQADVSIEEARSALDETGDIAQAIMKLRK